MDKPKLLIVDDVCYVKGKDHEECQVLCESDRQERRTSMITSDSSRLAVDSSTVGTGLTTLRTTVKLKIFS